MHLKLKLPLIGGALLIVAVGALALTGVLASESAPNPVTAAPVLVLPGGPSASPSPVAPTEEQSAAPERQLSGSEPEAAAPAVNLAAVRQMATDTLREYARFDTSESADARRSRIMGVAGADSTIADDVTGLSLPRGEGTVNWSARSGVVGEPYAGFQSETESTVVLSVVAQYWGSYGTPEVNSQQAQGTWTVTVEHNGDLANPTPVRVMSITEPDFILK